MFTSKNSMLKVDKIRRRTLRVVYDDYNSTCEELLASHNDTSIRQKHLKHLTIEVYKSLTNLNPKFMRPFFKNKSIPYNLRNGNICILAPGRSSPTSFPAHLFAIRGRRKRVPGTLQTRD